MAAGSSSAIVAGLVGVSGVFYLLWQLMGRLRKSSIRNKVVLITGASSGLGEGNTRIEAHSVKFGI